MPGRTCRGRVPGWTPEVPRLKAANGAQLPILGFQNVYFSINGMETSAKFAITNAIDSMILGIEWLSDHKCAWNMGTGEMSIDGRIVQLRSPNASQDSAETRHVFYEEKITIPAETQAILSVRAPLPHLRLKNDAWLTEPKEIRPGLLTGRTIVSGEIGAYVPVINASDQPVTVKRGWFLGHAECLNEMKNDVSEADSRACHCLDTSINEAETEQIPFIKMAQFENAKNAVNVNSHISCDRSNCAVDACLKPVYRECAHSIATRPVKASFVNEETLRQTVNSQCADAPSLTAVDDANVGHIFAARDAGDKIINASTKGDSSCHGTASTSKVAQRPGNDTVVVTDMSDTRALAARGRGRIRRCDVAAKAASEQSGVTADSIPFPGLSERRRRPAGFNRIPSLGKLRVDADCWSNARRTEEACPEAKQCRPDCQPPPIRIRAFAATGEPEPRSISPDRLAGQPTALTTPGRPKFVLYEGNFEQHSQSCTSQSLTRSRLYTQPTLDCNVLAVDQHDIQEADQGIMSAEDDRPEFAHLQPMQSSLPSVLTERQRLQASEVIFKNVGLFPRTVKDGLLVRTAPELDITEISNWSTDYLKQQQHTDPEISLAMDRS
jgi:hypothetical protein